MLNQVTDFLSDLLNEYDLHFKNSSVEYSEDYDYTSDLAFKASRLKIDASISYYYDILSLTEVTEFNNLVLLHYKSYADMTRTDFGSSIASLEQLWDMYDGILREFRSVVVNLDTMEIVLSPFKKFFGLNELEETKENYIRCLIDNAKNVEITDKLDGSMQQARYYNGSIIMSGSKALDPKRSWRLTKGYEYIKSRSGYEYLLKDYPDYTFIFEFIDEQDRHIVLYDEKDYGLHLIGARNSLTGVELSYKDIVNLAHKYDLPTIKIFNTTFSEVISNLASKKSDEAEGFVLNIDSTRVKVKYDDYVAINKILMSLSSPNTVIRMIECDRFDDLLSKVPEVYKEMIMINARLVFEYIRFLDSESDMYLKENYSENKKEFMIGVDKNVPKYLRHYVKNKYRGIKNNYLKNGNNSYVKLDHIKEILGVE